ncbi:large-conductance mechanosensitive channel protein MscL [Oscillospiraceae bacterium MB08-C2-2]|nr:large-conductance mechanosensitive channel protein MscL [Oscillospiraceae bacterium MB08-C2-2]
MKKLLEEFKAFALKGNVMDLAVAVVIGGAFGKIVTALVESIIMPLVGILLGGKNFSNLSITIGESVIAYGAFLQAVVDFIIIALAIFVFIKMLSTVTGKLKKQEPAAEPEAPKATPTEEYLLEIRDLLKEQKAEKTSDN